MKSNGFTLIEIMIVVAIVAILFVVAIPSYNDSVATGRRTDAQSALMGLSQAMERHFTQNNSYAGAITGAVPQPPDIFPTQSPIDSSPKYYNLRVTAVNATSFTLQAQPINGQVGDGVLQLNSLGQRVWDRDNDSDLAEASDACGSVSC